MPLPNATAADWGATPFSVEEFVSDAEVVDIPVVHEMGSRLETATIVATKRIEPSKRPVFVRVESQVITNAAPRGQSREYLATVRRRQARAIGAAIKGLEQHVERDDFVVCTYPVLTRINDLLTTLADAEAEGNTREVLRQLRNSLMNGGWTLYRDPSVREHVLDILRFLQDTEEVLPQKVDEIFNRLTDAGLNAVGMPLWPSVDESDAIDGEVEEHEVLG